MEDSDDDEIEEVEVNNDDNDDIDNIEAVQGENILPPQMHPFLARIRRALSRPDEDEEEEEQPDSVAGEALKFDTTLPAQHVYLGSGQEVAGRTILDEDLIQTLPLLSMPGFVLVPNQVFPLTLFHPAIISMMKSVLAATKTFGVVNLKANSGDWRGEIGTTAEIFEYREDSQSESSLAGFMLKARGRQRFKLKSTRRQIDGNLVGESVAFSIST
jgi:hypothetical protein